MSILVKVFIVKSFKLVNLVYSELKTDILPPTEGNDIGHTTNIQTVLDQFENKKEQEFYTYNI